jgi:hypothetical protein
MGILFLTLILLFAFKNYRTSPSAVPALTFAPTACLNLRSC